MLYARPKTSFRMGICRYVYILATHVDVYTIILGSLGAGGNNHDIIHTTSCTMTGIRNCSRRSPPPKTSPSSETLPLLRKRSSPPKTSQCSESAPLRGKKKTKSPPPKAPPSSENAPLSPKTSQSSESATLLRKHPLLPKTPPPPKTSQSSENSPLLRKRPSPPKALPSSENLPLLRKRKNNSIVTVCVAMQCYAILCNAMRCTDIGRSGVRCTASAYYNTSQILKNRTAHRQSVAPTGADKSAHRFCI